MADEARNLRRDRRKSNEVGDFNSGAGCEASRLGWRCRRKSDCLESGESGRGLPQSKIVSSRVMCLSAKAQSLAQSLRKPRATGNGNGSFRQLIAGLFCRWIAV